MKKILCLILFMIICVITMAQLSDKKYEKAVSDFVSLIRNKKIERLASKIDYPLRREYPLPSINTKSEFLMRYNEIFDEKLMKKIANSNPSKDWSDVGWRGIMLGHGDVWIDYDGNLEGVNYQSTIEKKWRDELIAKDKNNIHPSLREFENPTCILQTNKFKIRIDEVSRGSYRYASWSINKKMSERPDIIISGGEYVPDGNGGNHTFVFKNGGYIYNCQIIVLGEDKSPPARLVIYKGDKEILSQDADSL